MITALLPMNLSSASVRNTLAELAELGLVDKPHRSAGRVPTERGFRAYVDQLMRPRQLGDYERRDLVGSLHGSLERDVPHAASRLLSERTHQLGFVIAPRLERVVLRHVSFVRVSQERVLAVLVSQGGQAFQRLIEEPGRSDQIELDRMAATLNERLAGRTLLQVKEQLLREAAALRSHADLLLDRILRLGEPVGSAWEDELELVITTHLALLDQPEFEDPVLVRQLFQAVEAKERLAEVLEKVLERQGVKITFGDETEEPALRRCALVAAPYGGEDAPLGALGVIGPSRMDYARVVPVVDYLSRLVTEMVSE